MYERAGNPENIDVGAGIPNETLTEGEATAPPAPESTNGGRLRNFATTIGLGGIAAASLYAEAKGLNNDLPHTAKLAVDSGGHPLLGYVGGWMATSLFRNPSERVRAAAGIVGATIADFTTETVQSLTIASPQYADFMASRNLPETTKDYAFALAGLGLYLYQNRRQRS